MKSLFSTKTGLLVSLTIAALCSCKKDSVAPALSNTPISQVYKDESVGSLTFSKAKRNVLIPNTWDVFYTAYTSGSSTVMTNTQTLCSFYKTTGANGTSSGGHAIDRLLMDDKFNADFGLLPNYVNQVVYDDYGNSIWFQIVSLSIENSSTIQHFSGTSNVVGGTGKFVNAKGSVLLNGNMSVLNLDDFYIKNEGHISY